MNSTSHSSRNRQFTVKQESTLLNYLYAALSSESKTTVKSLLFHKQICVNGRSTTQFDAPLKPGDQVEIFFDRKSLPFSHPMMKIIYEDNDLIVIEKASGLLSMANEREKEHTAYHILNNYVKKSNPRANILIVHRLDRETSGTMIFAKTQEVREILQQNWDEMVLERKYVAVVEGQLPEATGTFQSYLTETKNTMVHSSRSPEDGKLAVTHYQTLRTGLNYSLIELDLVTGRKNQIRVHLSEAGHPVAGDKKYGATTNPLHRLALHAFKLRFIHPITRQEINFETPIPGNFKAILK